MGRSLVSFIIGVGHNPDPVTVVRGTNRGRGYAIPFRIIPEGGQVAEYVSEAQGKQSWHVLQDRVSRS